MFIEPATATGIPEDYMERVKTVHSVGGFGSQGYGYEWKIEEARKNLLRTHTTAVSAKMLYNLAQVSDVNYLSMGKENSLTCLRVGRIPTCKIF